MKKISITALTQFKQPDQVIIRSHGYFLYTVEIVASDMTFILAGSDNKPQQFREAAAIKAMLVKNGCQPRQVLLIQDTAYAEMIGLDNEPPRAMVTPLHWFSSEKPEGSTIVEH